jgi:hypothetical protein
MCSRVVIVSRSFPAAALRPQLPPLNTVDLRTHPGQNSSGLILLEDNPAEGPHQKHHGDEHALPDPRIQRLFC